APCSRQPRRRRLPSLDIRKSRGRRPVRLCGQASSSPACAALGRPVCAPGPLLVLFYRRPPPQWRSRTMAFASWIRGLRRSLNRPPASLGCRYGARPFLERLEDRTVPSTFTVTNTLDSGAGSLRQAILDANDSSNVGGPDTIAFNIP